MNEYYNEENNGAHMKCICLKDLSLCFLLFEWREQWLPNKNEVENYHKDLILFFIVICDILILSFLTSFSFLFKSA